MQEADADLVMPAAERLWRERQFAEMVRIIMRIVTDTGQKVMEHLKG